MHDLVIRNAIIVDGTGADRFEGDVASDAGRIVAVAVGQVEGQGEGEGRNEIDAAGHILTPRWVDVHTHYDGQVTHENGVATGALPGKLIRGPQATA